VEGSLGDHEPVDIAAILRGSDLSLENRRHVYDAVANEILSGWNPTRDAMVDLIDVAASRMTVDEYKTRAIAAAKSRSRDPGQT
jgi:hypothetical protein